MNCDNWVPMSEQVCSRSGSDLTVLSVLAKLRGSLLHTRSQSEAVVRRLREMEREVRWPPSSRADLAWSP